MHRLIIVLIATLSATLFACGEETAYSAAFENSQKAWLKAKADHRGTYVYETQFESFSDYGEITTLTVEDEVVTRRAFASYQEFAFRQGRLEAWTESGDEVGTHLTGAPAVSIDTLYERCQREVLTVDPTENEIIFSVDEQGLLRTCVYVPRGCIDDCDHGVSITAIEFRDA